MVEIMVSLLIIAVISTAAAAFIVNGLKGSTVQKERQQATFLADQQLEKIKGLPTSQISSTNLSSKLVEGRSQSAVSALFATAAANNMNIPRTDDETSAFNYDSSAGSNSLAVPTVTTVTINNLTYTIYNFVDVCWLDPSAGTCGTSETATTTMDYRATVDVTWTSKSCSGGCNYSDSTIIDPSLDATFNTNISTPSGTITSEANADSQLPALANGQVYTDSGLYMDASGTANTCEPNPSGSTYQGTLVTVTGSDFLAGMTADLSGTTRDSGSIVAASIYQPTASVVEFCLAGGDQPGNYTITLVNTDKGHFPLSIVEVPYVERANGWTTDDQTTTLQGGGIEAGATVTRDATSTGAATWSSATVTAPPTSDTSPALSTVALSNFSGPTNGTKAVLDIKNPDGTTATYTVTAPDATSTTPSGVGVPIGQMVTRTIGGTTFLNPYTSEPVQGSTQCTTPIRVPDASITATSYPITDSTYAVDANCAVGQHVVVNLYGTDGSSTSASWVIDALPAWSGVSPSSVPVSTSKTVTVTGSGFQSGATVVSQTVPSGGSAGLGTTTVASATSLSFSMNPTKVGSYTFSIKNPDGGLSTTTFAVTATGPPAETSISPGTIAGTNVNKTFTIAGTSVQSGAGVQLSSGPGTMSVTSTTVSPSSGITLVAKFSATGTYKLVIVNPDGGTSNTFNVVVDALPSVTSVTPSQVGVNATKTFTLSGSGVQSGATVQKVSGPGTVTAGVVSGSSTFSASFSASGTYTLQVVNPDGGVSNSFTITANPAAKITGLSPTSVSRRANTAWTLTGSNFQSGASVSFVYNGSALSLSNVTVASTTSISFNATTSNTKGTLSVSVTVTNPDGGTDTYATTVSAS